MPHVLLPSAPECSRIVPFSDPACPHTHRLLMGAEVTVAHVETFSVYELLRVVHEVGVRGTVFSRERKSFCELAARRDLAAEEGVGTRQGACAYAWWQVAGGG